MTEVRLLADRNIAAPMVRALRAAGIDVACVAEFASGITDDEVLEAAARDARLLLTDDKDFKELAFRTERGQTGVIMLRLPFALASENAVRVVNVLQEHSGRLVGFYTVIEPTRVRFRPLPDSMGLERVLAAGFVRPTAEKRGHHTYTFRATRRSICRQRRGTTSRRACRIQQSRSLTRCALASQDQGAREF